MSIDLFVPSLSRLWAAGFRRPDNIDELDGPELAAWLWVAGLPEDLLRANAALRPAVHPAHPSKEALGTILAHYDRTLARRQPSFERMVFAASFGYLPVIDDRGRTLFGHPWFHEDGTRLVLDVADRLHLGAFLLWQISVVSDLAADRGTRIVPARHRRIAAEALH